MEACTEWKTYERLKDSECNALRNLLYVGMTRARDYLTTLSKQGGQRELPTLSWIANTGISEGKISNNAAKLWGDYSQGLVYEDLPAVSENMNIIYIQVLKDITKNQSIYRQANCQRWS